MPQTPGKVQTSKPADNMRGCVLMTTAMAGYGFSDIVVKHLSSSLELGQTTFIRGLFSTIFFLILAKMSGQLGPLDTILQPAMFVRAMWEMLATLTFLLALFNIPIANTTAILQDLPLSRDAWCGNIFQRKNRLAPGSSNSHRIY